MRRIVRFFRTLSKAQRYYNNLLDKYDHVRIVLSPMFSESGIYAWDVK